MRFRPLVVVALALLTAACAPAPTASSTGPTTSLSPASVTTATPSPSTAPATGSAPASKTSATLSPSAGTIMDVYERFSTAAQIKATTWLPSDAKTFLVGQLELAQQEFRVNGSNANNCAVLEVSGYRVPDLINGYELGTAEPNCGGSGGLILWGNVAGKWKIIIAAQDVPACSDIRSAGWTSTIPKEWLGGQCMENDTLVLYKP
jgi:hypothetical protein